MERTCTIHVVLHQQYWCLRYCGKNYGQFLDKEDAEETARTWAENAEKQGHLVRVVTYTGDGPVLTLINVRSAPAEARPKPAEEANGHPIDDIVSPRRLSGFAK